MKLYELTEEFRQALEKYDPDNDELEILSRVIDGLAIDIENKSEGIVKLITNWSSDVDAIDAEIDRLKSLKESKQNRTNHLKQYLAHNLQHAGIDKLDLGTHRISFRKSSRVEVLDESKVPDKYKRVKTIVEVDKTAVKESWKQGIGVDGTTVTEHKNIQIR
jgi:hypothetical protein